jgi:methylase of polypeptide subunit release factors
MGCVSTSERLPEADPDRTGRLREALRAADFTADGLLDLLGGPAYAALARSEAVPALRATRGASPLETLVRLFLLQQSVPRERAREALPLDEALADGWLVPADATEADADATEAESNAEAGAQSAVRATVDVRPYAGPHGQDWWIVADLGCAVGGASGIGTQDGPHGRDVVLGVGGASTTLAGITVRAPVARALDIGTGSGVQALHAAEHASHVTATDLNPRALAVARLTLALSGASGVELREGTLFEPVAGDEPYDLIVSNPPFVISPGARLTYRDGGMTGDDLCRTLVEQSADRLAPGGYCQLLANWEHTQGEDWRDRLRSWVPPGCDAWIVQREVQDVTQYVELWLRDAGDHRAGRDRYAARYGEWLDEFERRGTTGVGFGWITLRKSGADDPAIVVEEWPHPVEQPLGDEVVQHFERQDFLRATDDAALLDCHFRLADGVVQEQVGMPGAEDPEHVVLRQQRGMRRATKVDTVGAGFAGVCDGSLPAWRILDAIAQLVGEDPVMLRDRTPGAIRLLVEQGFLLPAEAPA